MVTSIQTIAINGTIIRAALTSYVRPGKKSKLHSNMNVKTRDASNGDTDSSVDNKLNTFPNSSFLTSFDILDLMATEIIPDTEPK